MYAARRVAKPRRAGDQDSLATCGRGSKRAIHEPSISSKETRLPFDRKATNVNCWKKIVLTASSSFKATHWTAAFSELWQHFASAQHWRLYDDVAPTIKRLRDQGYRIAVASNFDERLTSILEEMANRPSGLTPS